MAPELAQHAYEEPSNMTPDGVVTAARAWRVAQGRGPVLQGREGERFRAMSLFRNAGGSSSIFVEDLVRETIAALLVHQYAATKFASGELITIQGGGNRGALSFGWNELDRTGLDPSSGLVSEQSDKIQSIDLTGKQRVQGIATVARAFDWTILDLDTAAMQGAFELVGMKARMTREQLDQDFDSYIAEGVTGVWPSFYDYPGALKATPITGTWSGATLANIIKDILHALDVYRQSNGGLFMPDTLVLASNLWKIVRQPYGNEGARMMLEVLRAAVPELTTITWERHLADGTAFFYRNSPDYVAAKRPVAFEFLPPEVSAMKFRVICRNRFAGVYSMRPESMLKMAGL
jgi:hypothetical protein